MFCCPMFSQFSHFPLKNYHSMELRSFLGRETQVHKWTYSNSIFQKNQVCFMPFDRRSALLDWLKCKEKKLIWDVREKSEILNISVMIIFSNFFFWCKAFSHSNFIIYVNENAAVSFCTYMMQELFLLKSK